MQVGRRGTRAAALVGIASLSLLASACGGSKSTAPPTTRAKPTTMTSAPATTTTDPAATAVPAAYRAASRAFVQALKGRPDPRASLFLACLVPKTKAL
jgi:hypothetical protein